MKKLINNPLHVVREFLEGLVDLDPNLALLENEDVVIRNDIPKNPAERLVALISGGGSGHEPAHAGFVGEGMLSAAVAGDVFTSPSVDAIYSAICAVSGPAGVLLIVKNYTGDRLNFSLAAELAKADGIPAELVFVADDVALGDRVIRERRRGIAGTVLVHKIAGAAAEKGASLLDLADIAREVAAEIATMGVGLGSCTVPAVGRPGFSLGAQEIELGLGIHGEKGLRRAKLSSSDQIVEEILEIILDDMGHLASGARLGLLVNGLGGTPPMELLIVARHALSFLRGKGLEIELAWTGNFMTALEMPGCSLTLLPLDDRRVELLTSSTKVRNWPHYAHIQPERNLVAGIRNETPELAVKAGPLTTTMMRAIKNISAALVEAEPLLTDLDSKAGDGDLGISMMRGAEALRIMPEAAYNTPHLLLQRMSEALRRAIAGSSGPFYATALMRASSELTDISQPTIAEWGCAFKAAIASVSEIGGASPGDRTMVDALAPAVDAWFEALERGEPAIGAFSSAAIAAESGAAATTQMTPKLGRASYLGDRAIGVPDGGAVAVSIWMKALAGSLSH